MIQNISIIGLIITIGEIAFAIYKYMQETRRKKCSDTLQTINNLFNGTYSAREEYLSAFNNSTFDLEKIESNKKIYKSTMILLTQWESFSRGLFYNIYDFQLFIYLVPKELSEMLDGLTKFVERERDHKNYNRLFSDFTYLSHDVSTCLQMKLDNKKIPKRYKQIRRLK